jgi:hypothetical protein
LVGDWLVDKMALKLVITLFADRFLNYPSYFHTGTGMKPYSRLHEPFAPQQQARNPKLPQSLYHFTYSTRSPALLLSFHNIQSIPRYH